MRKSNLRNKIKMYLKEKNKTSVEKEVFSLILSASQDYQELPTFFIKLYKEGINSGLIPKLTSIEEKINFCDRFYFQIEDLIRKSNEPIIFERDSFIKVQMTNWVFFEILRLCIIPIMNVVDKTTHEIKQKVQYEPELYSVLDNVLPSDKFEIHSS